MAAARGRKKVETSTPKRSEKVYALIGENNRATALIKAGRDLNLSIYDDEEDRRRAIRNCPNEQSIFVDEQSEYAIVEAILFEEGTLTVPREKPILQDFLDAHPDNEANGGGWFRWVNYEEDARKQVERDELITDIKIAIREKQKEADGAFALDMLASVIIGSVKKASSMQPSELKQVIYAKVVNDPEFFTDKAGNVNIFDDQYMIRKYTVLKAEYDNIIKKSANTRSFVWSDTNEIITTAPLGKNAVDHFVDFLATPEGMLVAEEIVARS